MMTIRIFRILRPHLPIRTRTPFVHAEGTLQDAGTPQIRKAPRISLLARELAAIHGFGNSECTHVRSASPLPCRITAGIARESHRFTQCLVLLPIFALMLQGLIDTLASRLIDRSGRRNAASGRNTDVRRREFPANHSPLGRLPSPPKMIDASRACFLREGKKGVLRDRNLKHILSHSRPSQSGPTRLDYCAVFQGARELTIWTA